MRCSKRTGMILVGLGLVLACLVAMARRQQRGGESTAERPTMWDKMRQGMEEMPEDFPPRVMYDNVEMARANTERILQILEEKGESGQATGNKARADA